MITVNKFSFNPFQVNTYVLYDESRECVIIDAGCHDQREQQELVDFIAKENLKPVRLMNTHSHIDHIAGNAFLMDHFGLKLEAHFDGKKFVEHSGASASFYGFGGFDARMPELHLEEGMVITFGNSSLEILDTPGHAAGSICFVCHPQKFVIVGDVLFYQSIGRTDLPTGDFDLLIDSIRNKLFTLPKDFTVYSGHGPETNIGFEMYSNPFLADLGA
jgi:glyoxylase-like metal-dependent hydrolase (beta-lactamase superfamily II)